MTSVLEDCIKVSEGKRTSVLMITDGHPDHPESVEALLVDKANSLEDPNEFSITIIQVRLFMVMGIAAL